MRRRLYAGERGATRAAPDFIDGFHAGYLRRRAAVTANINVAAGTRSPARRTTTAQLGRSRVLELESGLGQHSIRCLVLEFRLLYLRANRLERWEIIEAETALAAVHEAASRPSDDITELWSDHGKIAIFRPVGGHAGAWANAHTSRDTP